MTALPHPDGEERIILLATVGSTAYGLAREGSDIDSLGVFVAPSRAFWRLGQPRESIVHTKPDCTMHEIGKYLRLTLRCNPTLIELLWLPPDFVTYVDTWGWELRAARHAFLSEQCVREAFGGYAKQQAERLQRRTSEGKKGFSADTQNRTAKHARHCFRLLRQGRQLLETGELVVKVDNPSDYFAFDEMGVPEIVERFEVEDAQFRAARSVLPLKPDRDRVEKLLLQIRESFL